MNILINISQILQVHRFLIVEHTRLICDGTVDGELGLVYRPILHPSMIEIDPIAPQGIVAVPRTVFGRVYFVLYAHIFILIVVNKGLKQHDGVITESHQQAVGRIGTDP